MEDIYIRVGRRVRELRQKFDITQEKLAELTNLSVPFIGQIERAENRPSLVTIQKIADALNVPVELIFSDIYPAKNHVKYKMTNKVAVLFKDKKPADQKFLFDLVKLIDRKIKHKTKKKY